MRQLAFVYCLTLFALSCTTSLHAQLTREEKRVYADAKPGPFEMKKRELQGIIFSRIPAGSFPMGSPRKESKLLGGDIMGRDPDEKLHLVELSEYWMSVHEVTQATFEQVMGYNPSHCESLGDDDWRVGEDLSQHPVQGLNWFEALEFCNKLSEADGRTPCYTVRPTETREFRGKRQTLTARVSFAKSANGFRLPTEAEWEYACRAGTITPFFDGDSLSAKRANIAKVVGHTTQVGSYAPNAWGLFDMHGNVFEWCHDRFEERHAALSRKDPMSLPTGLYGAKGASVAIRGESYRGREILQRTASRCGVMPYLAVTGPSSCGTGGFRIVLPARSLKGK